MRKWLVFLCMFFLVLSIVTYNNLFKDTNEVDVYSVASDEVIIYDEIKSGKNIKLRNSNTDEITEIDLYDYLRCVVASEMPADYEYEALKAQAIVARTYLYKCMEISKEELADVCDGTHCQVYEQKDEILRLWKNIKGWSDEEIEKNWQKVNSAVISTSNQVITYNGELIEAYFHASSPVKTENLDQIWGKKSLPYLVSVESTEVEDYPNRESMLQIEYTYFKDKIRECINSNFDYTNKDIKIASYTTSGRVNEIEVDGYKISAEELRKIFGLKSTLFTVEKNEDGFLFSVIGYGHGIGMSQVGANYLALNGKNARDIITHYYTGVTLDKID